MTTTTAPAPLLDLEQFRGKKKYNDFTTEDRESIDDAIIFELEVNEPYQFFPTLDEECLRSVLELTNRHVSQHTFQDCLSNWTDIDEDSFHIDVLLLPLPILCIVCLASVRVHRGIEGA